MNNHCRVDSPNSVAWGGSPDHSPLAYHATPLACQTTPVAAHASPSNIDYADNTSDIEIKTEYIGRALPLRRSAFHFSLLSWIKSQSFLLLPRQKRIILNLDSFFYFGATGCSVGQRGSGKFLFVTS